ncbi:MAG: hypothetical protein KKA54_19820 [Proteobacteria bacterium]|nr:hypothetical protein [Pseudomonadota bacterium]MBU0968619.1 hypothetical protein [Pseudomonadota bacterium]
MKNAPHTLPPFVINLFFVIGLMSALSFRALMAIKDLQPQLLRPVWYMGIIGYILFFGFRYSITEKRKKAICEFKLIDKLKKGEELSPNDRQVMTYILSSLQKSRENLNYLFIFATSAIAILLDLLF